MINNYFKHSNDSFYYALQQILFTLLLNTYMITMLIYEWAHMIQEEWAPYHLEWQLLRYYIFQEI